MKEIFIKLGLEKETHLLTDEEFEKCLNAWAGRASFYCERLETNIPQYCYAKKPPEDVGYEVFLLVGKDAVTKIFKKGEKYFKHSFSSASGGKHREVRLTDEVKKKLIPQEAYYAQKMYIS